MIAPREPGGEETMCGSRWPWLLPGAVLLCLPLAPVHALEWPAWLCRGDRTDQFSRAGNSRQIARWARPSSSRFYRGYYIGGGAVFGGDARDVRREGTWGWDFAPSYSRVKLRWWHGRRLQGGGGEYRSDGRIPLSWRELLP